MSNYLFTTKRQVTVLKFTIYLCDIGYSFIREFANKHHSVDFAGDRSIPFMSSSFVV